MRRIAFVALLCCAALPAGANGGEDPKTALECGASAVALVQGRYEGMRDLRASFVQSHRSVALGSGPAAAATRSEGRVVFAKPGRMRWSYESPEPSLVVSDGQTLWLYDPGRREAHRLPVSDGYLSGAAIQFLLGQGDVAADFEVTPLACGSGPHELELVPREPASYERLRLGIDPGSGDVLYTEIVDLLGNLTRVEFREIEVDFGADPALFRFEPPADVRVIDLGVTNRGSEG